MFAEFHRRLTALDDKGSAYTVTFCTCSGKIYRDVDVIKHTFDFIEIERPLRQWGPRLIKGSELTWTEIEEL